jgi:hypothetical protein
MVTTKEGMCILRKYLNNIDFRKKKENTHICLRHQDVESCIKMWKVIFQILR